MSKRELFTSTPDTSVLSATDYAFNPRTARAFCLGRLASANGDLIGTVPFSVTTERENYYAWRAGWTNHNGGAAASTTSCAV
jgi:hypothetical protein